MVECDFNYEGYDLAFDSYGSAVLEPVYGEDARFSVEFTMKSAGMAG